ncbi:hypothetical protein FOCC_FOCC016234 [Frankliniella occidentalis]|nr:hypothetical protein FOCC_FOCC016234 [Frankliniella occidentalis]
MNITLDYVKKMTEDLWDGLGDGELLSWSPAAVACATAAFLMVPVTVALLKKCKQGTPALDKHAELLSSVHFYSGSPPDANNNKRCIELLSKFPELVNQPLTKDHYTSHGYTPFLRACWNNNFELIKFMLSAGADIRLTNSDGETALYLVAYRVSKSQTWDPKALNLLWNAGCSVDDVNVHNNSMLHLAAKAGHATLTRWLLLHGAEPKVMNEAGYTPYKLALKKGSTAHKLVAALLDHRATTNEDRKVVVRSDGVYLERGVSSLL